MKHKDSKVRIGVKYCGGCNPGYDRVALIKEIQERAKLKADFVPWESEDIDIALIVCGCKTACVDLDPFAGLRILTIKNPECIDDLLKDIV